MGLEEKRDTTEIAKAILGLMPSIAYIREPIAD